MVGSVPTAVLYICLVFSGGGLYFMAHVCPFLRVFCASHYMGTLEQFPIPQWIPRNGLRYVVQEAGFYFLFLRNVK